MDALRYAQQLSSDVTAVHVSMNAEDSEQIRKEWEYCGKGTRLVILESPYRMFLEPMLQYINEIANQRQPNEIITVVVPQFVPKRWLFNLLHTQTAMLLRLVLLFKKDLIITDIPYSFD